MKQIFFVTVLTGLSITKLPAQIKVNVQVHPGSELMSVIWLLSDPKRTTLSAYRKDAENFFNQFAGDEAVMKVKKLPWTSCDFPLRLSWVFYDFPQLKLSEPDTLLGFDKWFDKKQMRDYLAACLGFYQRSNFKAFFKKEQPKYRKWISNFNKKMQADSLLFVIDKFYRFAPPQKIEITLGAMSCGTYAVPVELINPHIPNTTVIMIGYGNLIGLKATDTAQPDFYDPLFTNQLVWHELGHAYLVDLFKQYKNQIDSLEYIRERDSLMKKKSANMGWTMFLNENITQSVTSLLRINTGKIGREAEYNRIAEDSFYLMMPKIIDIIQHDYVESNKYSNFNEFFPVLLKELKREYPE